VRYLQRLADLLFAQNAERFSPCIREEPEPPCVEAIEFPTAAEIEVDFTV